MKKKTDTSSGKTSKESGHDHKFTVDVEGNGKTSWDSGHDHKITENIVEKVSGHRHILPSTTNRFEKILKKGDK